MKSDYLSSPERWSRDKVHNKIIGLREHLAHMYAFRPFETQRYPPGSIEFAVRSSLNKLIQSCEINSGRKEDGSIGLSAQNNTGEHFHGKCKEPYLSYIEVARIRAEALAILAGTTNIFGSI